MLPDLGVASETVDLAVVLPLLEHTLRLQGKVLNWSSLYLTGRSLSLLIEPRLSQHSIPGSFSVECS